jgi:hypothetical protein
MLPAKPVIASATLSCTPVSVRRNCLRFIRAAILRSTTESLKVGLAGLRSDGASSCSHLDCSFKRSPNGLASGIRIARGFRSEATLHRGSGLNVNKLASCDSRFGRLRTGKRRAEGSPHPSPCSCGWLRNVRMPRRTACRLAGKGTKHRHAPRSRCEGLEGPDGFAPAKVSNALSSTDGGSIPREPEVVRVSCPMQQVISLVEQLRTMGIEVPLIPCSTGHSARAILFTQATALRSRQESSRLKQRLLNGV